ncbi:MAG: CoA pyrophosphatase [Bryobacterales bacterium]|nr:CoA pyrophosphatase [Bryobacterales bacterium]
MGTPEAAVAILRTRRAPESVLLMRRAERQGDAWSGHWSFPGGRCEPGDADALDTALRELEEECAVRLGRECLESALPLTVARRKIGRFLLVAPYVFRIEAELPATPDPREAAEALWVPLSVLLDSRRHYLGCVPGRPACMLYPVVDLNVAPLWGFTYRLITEWLGLVPSGAAGEEAGFEAARRVLDFLLSQGVAVERDWENVEEAGRPVRRVLVRGDIPAGAVLARFSVPGPEVPRINLLEVRPGSVRITGLAYEEYVIQAA